MRNCKQPFLCVFLQAQRVNTIAGNNLLRFCHHKVVDHNEDRHVLIGCWRIGIQKGYFVFGEIDGNGCAVGYVDCFTAFGTFNLVSIVAFKRFLVLLRTLRRIIGGNGLRSIVTEEQCPHCNADCQNQDYRKNGGYDNKLFL